jgi:hypothetical protein
MPGGGVRPAWRNIVPASQAGTLTLDASPSSDRAARPMFAESDIAIAP